jgi:hypothetical protein
MKINRQNITEDYSSESKAGWLDDFSKNLEKNADYLDNLKTIIKKRQDFSSIDEKMADMKARAGFNLIKDMSDPEQAKVAKDTSSESEGCSCDRNKCRECNSELFRLLEAIITYIKDFAKDRGDVGLLGIMTHCRQHPTLEFQRAESLIDDKKFKALVQKIIGDKSSRDEVKYIPEDSSEEESANEIAEYISHADPSIG